MPNPSELARQESETSWERHTKEYGVISKVSIVGCSGCNHLAEQVRDLTAKLSFAVKTIKMDMEEINDFCQRIIAAETRAKAFRDEATRLRLTLQQAQGVSQHEHTTPA